jgi:uncharacterized protein involved in exopolysaccharide biosynthesis
VICAATVFFLTKKTKKQYISSTTLYTGVASGYSITSTDDERLDYFAVNNAFDNLLASAKSRETIEQVALHLLAEHLMLSKPDPQVLGAAGFEGLKKLAGKDLMAKAKSFKDEQSVYNYISDVYLSKNDNPIANILTKPGSFYSIDDLRTNLVVTRINTSDIIQVVFTCNDPAVCLRTLELHSNIFTANYKRIKSDQTFSAVKYFETQLAESKARLQASEDELKTFGQQHHIINYYEQTRYVAESKENLEKEIYSQKEAQSGTKNALSMVNQKLSERQDQAANDANMMNLRQHLSQVTADLEKAKVYNNPEKITAYSRKAKLIGDSLKSATNEYMNLNYTAESVPRPSLVQQYVDNSVANKKASAGLGVLTNQRQNYLNEIDELAPLGSTLKRLERQIDVNEKEFLEVLHGLHLAQLRQSNLALSSNIAVQDKPYFPLQAQPSTRALLIVLSFFVGIISVVSVVLGREFMDSSIRSPERLKKIVNLPLAGISIVPPGEKAQPYQLSLHNLLTEKFISTILPYLAQSIDEKKTALLSFITTRKDVISAADIKLLHRLFTSIYPEVFWIIPTGISGAFLDAVPRDDYSVYTPSIAQLNYKNVQQLAQQDLSGRRLIIYLAPDLSQHSLPVSIARESAIIILACRADDTWQPVDKDILTKTRTTVPEKPFFTWLVNVDETNLDSVVGEIPKKRSWLRKKIKKMVTLNLR